MNRTADSPDTVIRGSYEEKQIKVLKLSIYKVSCPNMLPNQLFYSVLIKVTVLITAWLHFP